MATTVRTTNAPGGDINTAERDIANGYFTAGAVINDMHYSYLKNLVNKVCGHTHILTDYSAIHNYGNTGSSASTSEATVAAGTDSTVTVTQGSVISHVHYNGLRNAVNTVRSHNHGWTDN